MIIQAAILLFTLSLLYISMTNRLSGYLHVLVLQGILLAVVIAYQHHLLITQPFSSASSHQILTLVFLLFETLIIKTILLPFFIYKSMKKNQVYRDKEPYNNFLPSLVFSSMILVGGFLISFWLSQIDSKVEPLYFGTALSAMLIGLLIIMTRRKLISHIMGFVLFENGIFLLALSAKHEMPMVLNLGVLMDLFIAVFLLGFFATEIHKVFGNMDVDELTHLKDTNK